MTAADPAIEITAQRGVVSEEKARKRVIERPVARLKRLVVDREIVRVLRRYKPFYAFDAVLTKRMFAGEDLVYEGLIVVDALSGLSRPFLKEQVDLIEERAAESALIPPDLDESDAHREARSRRMQVEHREGGEVEMVETSRMVYKPVWLVELTNGDVRVVDATNGRVVGDEVLG